MNNTKRSIVRQISVESIDLDWKIAFGGKAYGNKHLFRVAKIVKYLLKNEPGDDFVSQVGGWVHDVSLAWGNDYDSKIVEERTLNFLKKYKKQINPEEMNKIIKCASFHECNSGQLSNEAKIVHDADVIDKCGYLGIIRHIWKMTNMLENKILKSQSDLDKLKKHLANRREKIFTKSASRIVLRLNKQQENFFKNNKDALEKMNLISTLAASGIASDKIAIRICKLSDFSTSKLIKDQLSCSYLK